MARFLVLLLPLLVGSLSARTDPAELERWLERYLGSWEGEVVVESSDGRELRRFPVAAEYWRDGGAVLALTAFEINGEMTFVTGRNFLRNGLLFADVTQAGKTVTYRGYLRGEELYWIPYDAELNTERRMKEWFSEQDGEEVLHVEGIERLRKPGKGQAKVLLRAKMKRSAR